METSYEPEEPNEYAPKTIKFPKFRKEDGAFYYAPFYKTTIERSRGRISVLLQKQTILGVEIPDRTPLSVYDKYGISDEFSMRPKLMLETEFVERMLKSMILEKLRNASPSSTKQKGRG